MPTNGKKEIKRTMVFIHSFKSKRSDGKNCNICYGMYNTGEVIVQFSILDKELNFGFEENRKFNNLIYQTKTIPFKLSTFLEISKDVIGHLHLLNPKEVIGTLDYNEEQITQENQNQNHENKD